MLIVVEFEGGDALSNLTLLNSFFEPRGCSSGNEQYSIINSREMMLTHLLAGCSAEITLTAKVHSQYSYSFLCYFIEYCMLACLQLPDMSIVAGENITLVTSLEEYYSTSSISNSWRTNYAQGQVSHCLINTLPLSKTISVVH